MGNGSLVSIFGYVCTTLRKKLLGTSSGCSVARYRVPQQCGKVSGSNPLMKENKKHSISNG
jgi:hypothetical protein